MHPDFFSAPSTSDALRAASAAASSSLNVAYRTLRSPSGRAQYLLRLQGGEALEGGSANDGSGGGNRHVSPALLLEIMEAREQVEDAATPPDALQRLRERTRTAQAACARDLAAAFRQGAPGLPRARDIAVALSYYDKLLEEVEARQEAAAAAARPQ